MPDKLTAKEALFCEYYKILRSPREAAARAGYRAPEKSGLRLLRKKGIKRVIDRAEKPNCAAVDGLRRLAFGSVADAVTLCLGGVSGPEELEKLDLFMLSELKFTKGGGIEAKFFDRLKALQLLAEAETEGVGTGAEPFYRALCEGAKNLSSECRDGV